MSSFMRCLIVVLFAGFGLSGCRSAKPQPAPTEIALQKLSVLYGQYLSSHRGKSPENEAEFRKHIESLSETDRRNRGISDISEIFLSPRDGQAYVVRYGVKLGAPGPDAVPWVAHEKEGQNGKRFMVFVTGQIEEVDEVRFWKITHEGK